MNNSYQKEEIKGINKEKIVKNLELKVMRLKYLQIIFLFQKAKTLS